MCPLPDHGRAIAMDRPDAVGDPALKATQRQWPQDAKVTHFMTRGIGAWKHAREALVAGFEFVILFARDGGVVQLQHSLTRTWTGDDEDVESAAALQGRHLVRHCAEIEDVHIIGASDHVVVAKFQHDLWRRSASPLSP